ncbi:MAG: hypothetical protein DRN29_08175, partial [Thermoplasmata archaeon]
IWMTKGAILMDLNKPKEAMEYFDRAIEIDENNDFAIASKGVALYKIGKDKEGEKYLDRALEINPKSFTALYWKGEMKGRKGKKEEEIELKGNAAFILFAAGGGEGALKIFREVYYSGVDLPIRYECGVAYAAMADYLLLLADEEDAEKVREEINKIVEDCWEHRNMICKSARALLNDMVGEEVESIVVNDEKDFVFKKLFEPSYEMEG